MTMTMTMTIWLYDYDYDKMADDSHLENREIVISRQQFDRSSRNLAQWRTL